MLILLTKIGEKIMSAITTWGCTSIMNDDSFYHELELKEESLFIKQVIFNDPATIVIWSDDTKTTVKCNNEPFDEEKGLAMAISKKFLQDWSPKKSFGQKLEKLLSRAKRPVKAKKKTEKVTRYKNYKKVDARL